MDHVELWTMGISLPSIAARAAARAEAAGWDGMLVVDSQNLAGDPYVALTLAARETSTLGLGTGVTNSLTRHPAATAAAIASVHVASGGRAVLGVGRGDSALAHLGLAPTPVPLLERYVSLVRAYLRGESVTFTALAGFGDDATRSVEALGLADAPSTSRLHWLPPDLAPVPVEVAATGPRVLAAAARAADRVLLAVGADPVRVAWAIDHVRAARSEAGLDPAGVAIGAFVNVVAHADRSVARQLASGGITTFARFSVMDGAVRTPVTDEQREVLGAVHAKYDMNHHTQAGSAQTTALTDSFVDRFAIVGPSTECIARLTELVDLGVDRLVVTGPSLGSDPAEAKAAAQRFSEEVLPAVRTATPA